MNNSQDLLLIRF